MRSEAAAEALSAETRVTDAIYAAGYSGPSRFYAEAGAADPETARLLEAYLDRRLGADWRAKAQEKPSSSKQRPRGSSDMTREEAYRVLGLQDGASGEEIRDAYKRLMMSLHPDRGGTDYLAAKINEAKDVLLG